MNKVSRLGVLWAIVGAVVLVAAVVGSVVLVAGRESDPQPTSSSTYDPGPSDPGTPMSTATVDPDGAGPDEVVYGNVAEFGWVAEPITTDPEVYLRAAFNLPRTYDTAAASRDQFRDYLYTWLTPDPRYPDAEARLEAQRRDLVVEVLPAANAWDEFATRSVKVVSRLSGDIEISETPNAPSTGTMVTARAPVTVTYSGVDSGGVAFEYDLEERWVVQVYCDGPTVPAPDSAQSVGDCKLVRLYSGDS